MIAFFTPPFVYIVLFIIFLLSTLIFWKKDVIIKKISEWEFYKITIGPLSFKHNTNVDKSKITEPGVSFHGTFSGSKFNKIAGRDNIQSYEPSPNNGATPGIKIDGDFTDVSLIDIAGRDNERTK